MLEELEELAEELRDYFYDNRIEEQQVEYDEDASEINIYLDLPDTDNYDDYVREIELFFRSSDSDIDDFDIDGDYEGVITLTYEGE